MRVMLFAHIFYKQQYSFTPDPNTDQKLMLFLANWPAWCDPALWKNIAIIRLSFEKEQAKASTGKEESKEEVPKREFDAARVMDGVIQDMYLCQLTKLTVSQLLTQISEIEGLVSKDQMAEIVQKLTAEKEETPQPHEAVDQSNSTQQFTGYAEEAPDSQKKT